LTRLLHHDRIRTVLTLAHSRLASFSLHPPILEDILHHARPLGHNEDPNTLNLGFGFVYYGLARALRPAHVLVIGSGFGFSVVCFALGLKDNGEGALTFVDPSYSLFKNGPLQTIGGTSQWDEPDKVRSHFARFGVEHIVNHFKVTSHEFFERYEERRLPAIDVGFIDGNHSFEDVRHDFIEAMRHTKRGSVLLLHDTNIYVREMVRHAGVKRWLRILQRDHDWFEVVDFPLSSGVAMVRVLRDGPWHPGA
jgi:predicted O-methyltransferase YrrM